MAFVGSGQTSTKDDWFDLSSYAPNPNSPIPSGKQLWIGYATFISEDKDLIFELRPNISGQSTGTLANTQLRGFTSVPSADSKDVDFYLGGNILTLFPVTGPSSGIEKLWLRVRSSSQTVAVFDFFIHYALY